MLASEWIRPWLESLAASRGPQGPVSFLSNGAESDYQWKRHPSEQTECNLDRVRELLELGGLSPFCCAGKAALDVTCGCGRHAHPLRKE